jgi:hypothetical protein
MLNRDDITPGLYVQTVSDRLGVPAQTFARVETLGTVWTGEFVFTVRWLNIKPGSKQRPRSDWSLNLWEQDLAHFEVLGDHEASAVKTTTLHRPLSLKILGGPRHSKIKMIDPRQLTLLEDLR